MPEHSLSPEDLVVVFRSITEYAIFTIDTDGRITSWNEGAQRLFGHTADDALGQSTDILFVPEDRARRAYSGEIRQARESGRAADAIPVRTALGSIAADSCSHCVTTQASSQASSRCAET